MWLALTILSSLLFAVLQLITREYARKGRPDMWIWSFSFSGFAALVLLPIIFFIPFSQLTLANYIHFIIMSAVVVAANLFIFSAYTRLSATPIVVLQKLRLLILTAVGVWFFSEVFSAFSLVGAVLILIGGLCAIDFKNWSTDRLGVIYALASSACLTVFVIMLEYGLQNGIPITAFYLIFPISAVITAIVTKNFSVRLRSFTPAWKLGLLAGSLGAIANALVLVAISYPVFSKVYWASEAMLIFVLLGEIFILKETRRLSFKLASVLLTIIGVVLLTL